MKYINWTIRSEAPSAPACVFREHLLVKNFIRGVVNKKFSGDIDKELQLFSITILDARIGGGEGVMGVGGGAGGVGGLGQLLIMAIFLLLIIYLDSVDREIVSPDNPMRVLIQIKRSNSKIGEFVIIPKL